MMLCFRRRPLDNSCTTTPARTLVLGTRGIYLRRVCIWYEYLLFRRNVERTIQVVETPNIMDKGKLCQCCSVHHIHWRTSRAYRCSVNYTQAKLVKQFSRAKQKNKLQWIALINLSSKRDQSASRAHANDRTLRIAGGCRVQERYTQVGGVAMAKGEEESPKYDAFAHIVLLRLVYSSLQIQEITLRIYLNQSTLLLG